MTRGDSRSGRPLSDIGAGDTTGIQEPKGAHPPPPKGPGAAAATRETEGEGGAEGTTRARRSGSRRPRSPTPGMRPHRVRSSTSPRTQGWTSPPTNKGGPQPRARDRRPPTPTAAPHPVAPPTNHQAQPPAWQTSPAGAPNPRPPTNPQSSQAPHAHHPRPRPHPARSSTTTAAHINQQPQLLIDCQLVKG